MAGCDEGTIPPKNVEFFHSFPHVDFNFDNISSTFRPTDKDYDQDLLVYSAIPVAIGALLFIIFSLYLLVHCCSFCCWKPVPRHKLKSKRVAVLGAFICISALICCGSIISGCVFNDGIDNGVNTVTKAMDNVTDTFDGVYNEVANVQNNILDIKSDISRIKDLPGTSDQAREYLDEMTSYIMGIISELNRVKKQHAPDIAGYVKTGEYYRLWAVFGILGLGILTSLFAVYSSIRYSRCGFFLALLFGCVAFLLDWLVIGSHVGAAIGMSDLCVDPRKTIEFYLTTSSLSTKEIVDYYLNCIPGSTHPYEKYVDSSLDLILTGEEFLKKLSTQLQPKDIKQLTTDLYDTESSLNQIKHDLKCESVNQEYHKARCAVCFPVVGGISWLLLMSFLIVVFLAIMLLLIVPMCKSIHHKKRRHGMNSMLNGLESSETQYHSVSIDEESVPLMPSCPPPPYEATARTVEYQFHSCQEDRNRANSTAQQQPVYHQPNEYHQQDSPLSPQSNLAPPPPRGQVLPVERKVTMAF